jgi:hypothetical protein
MPIDIGRLKTSIDWATFYEILNTLNWREKEILNNFFIRFLNILILQIPFLDNLLNLKINFPGHAFRSD